jgi:hypothetical protein
VWEFRKREAESVVHYSVYYGIIVVIDVEYSLSDAFGE